MIPVKIYPDVFERALEVTLREEGGWANVAGDHGGPTMQGVTQRTYNQYRDSMRLPRQNVRNVTRAEIWDLYYSMYWLMACCHLMPAELAADAFDWAVHGGPGRSIMTLQQVLGVKTDGVFGPMTKAKLDRAIESAGITQVNQKFNEIRKAYLAERAKAPGQWKFFRGWMNRMARIAKNLYNPSTP